MPDYNFYIDAEDAIPVRRKVLPYGENFDEILGADGKWRPYPVEFKRAIDADAAQVLADEWVGAPVDMTQDVTFDELSRELAREGEGDEDGQA